MEEEAFQLGYTHPFWQISTNPVDSQTTFANENSSYTNTKCRINKQHRQKSKSETETKNRNQTKNIHRGFFFGQWLFKYLENLENLYYFKYDKNWMDLDTFLNIFETKPVRFKLLCHRCLDIMHDYY